MQFRPLCDNSGVSKNITETIGRCGAFWYAQICFYLFALLFLNCFTVQAQYQSQNQSQTPHPAVVRIIAQQGQNQYFGSGTLIAKKTNYGFVITNWHVVRDSNGYVKVRFSTGRDFEAAVVAVDDRWDLALLVIAEPDGIDPVVISRDIPRINDTLWVAGYPGDGAGAYRIQGGRCLSFFQPERDNIEAELIEISVPSENGCSGGPVFNAKYELAGVLFGSTDTTIASHCGRVIKFLEQAAPHVASLPAGPETVIKAASLSQQSILQRGGIDFSSATSRGSNNPVSSPNNVLAPVSSSSSSFGGSDIRPRNRNQEASSQQLTRLTRHGFLSLKYDLTAANALLTTESRAGTTASSPTGTPVTGGFALRETNPTTTATTTQPTVTPANNYASSNLTTGNPSTGTSSDYSSRNNSTSGVVQPTPSSNSLSTTSSPSNSTASTPRSGYSGSSQTPYSPTEAIPNSASRPAVATPAYGNNAGNASSNERTSRQTYGTGSQDGTVTFESSAQRRTETTPSGTRSGSGRDSNSSSSGLSGNSTSGGRSDSSSPTFNTYSQKSNATTPTSSPNAPQSSSLWSNDDLASQYALDISDMQADEVTPKYADEFGADPTETDISGAVSKWDAIKIVVAILVIFFILFHTVKTMAVAEERQSLA